MSLSYRARPGAGLLVLGISALGAVCFFAWGLTTPPLDEVWRLQIELGLRGVAPLTGRQFRLLQDTLRRYPALADSMLEKGVGSVVSANHKGVVDTGYAYLLRKGPDAPGRLQVTAIGDTRVGLEVRTQGASAAGEARGDATYAWQVPNDGPFPQLVEVRLTGARQDAPRRHKKDGKRQRDGDRAPPMLMTLTP